MASPTAAPAAPVPPIEDDPLPAPSLPPTETDGAATPVLSETVIKSAPSVESFPTLPSLTGAIGLLHASTAEVGPANQLRLGLHGEYFGANSFLIAGDSNQRLAGGLAVGYTPRRDLEIFGAILNSSNRNRRFRDPNLDRDPELIKTFGDLVLGAKWILPLSPAATFGVELGLKFLAGVSDLAVSPSSTSWWLGPLFTYDWRKSSHLPLRFHAGASFYDDNSGNLRGLSGTSRDTKEVAMFAYGIAPSRLRVALAIDAPLQAAFPHVPIVPFIEYHLAYITADADKDFQDFMPPSCGAGDPGKMPCIDNRDMQWLTFGARADVYHGITVDLGFDVRVRSPGFPYGPPTPPLNVVFGVSYPLDLDSLTRTVVVTRTVEKEGPWKTQGFVTGTVRNARDATPVAGAVVTLVGRPHAGAVSDADGGFTTANVATGPVEVEISAPNFEPGKATTTIVAERATEIAVSLVPNPPVAKVHGRVTDGRGAGLEAALTFSGGEVRNTKSDGAGAYAASLPPGTYQVKAEAAGQPPRTVSVELAAGQDKQLDLVLRAATPNPNVVLGPQGIALKKPIRFVGATAQLTAASEALLDGVADVLDVHGEIKRLGIVAHWDGGLAKPAAVELTQSQAETVRAYLVRKGISETRLTATGAGASKPLVPNLVPANRMRNRRVEFVVE